MSAAELFSEVDIAKKMATPSISDSGYLKSSKISAATEDVSRGSDYRAQLLALDCAAHKVRGGIWTKSTDPSVRYNSA